MAWQFRRRIKIAPGVRLNISKGGVSTSFGVRGVNITTGKRETFLNTEIPETGIYNRQKISGGGTPKVIDWSPQILLCKGRCLTTVLVLFPP